MKQGYRLVRRWTIAVLAAILLGGAAVALAAPASLASLTQTGGTGYDPLNAGEQSRALQAAAQSIGASPAVLAAAASALHTAMPQGLAPTPPRPDQELLLVERHQEEKSVYAQAKWPRRADVYIYRYTDNSLLHEVYDLDKNQIDSSEAVKGVQLPLTPAEVQRALAIAFADPSVRPQLNAQYAQIAHQPLTSPDQLKVKAMVFHASAMGNTNLGAAATCGQTRCAQLLMAAGDNIVLQLIPIVDLSAGAVTDVLPFSGAAH